MEQSCGAICHIIAGIKRMRRCGNKGDREQYAQHQAHWDHDCLTKERYDMKSAHKPPRFLRASRTDPSRKHFHLYVHLHDLAILVAFLEASWASSLALKINHSRFNCPELEARQILEIQCQPGIARFSPLASWSVNIYLTSSINVNIYTARDSWLRSKQMLRQPQLKIFWPSL